MTKQKQNSKKQISLRFILAVLLLIILTAGVFASWAANEVNNASSAPALTAGLSAAEQDDQAVKLVSLFYSDYIKPAASAARRQQLIEFMGDANFVTQHPYGQQGLSSIVCSTIMPAHIVAAFVSPSVINVRAFYPDSTFQDIAVHILVNSGGEIDSVTCPSVAKENLYK